MYIQDKEESDKDLEKKDSFAGEYTESLHYKPKTQVSADTIDALLAEINS